MKLACGRFRVDGRGAERRSKTWGKWWGVRPPSIDGVGREADPANPPKQAGLHVGPGSRSAGSAALGGLAGCQQATV